MIWLIIVNVAAVAFAAGWFFSRRTPAWRKAFNEIYLKEFDAIRRENYCTAAEMAREAGQHDLAAKIARKWRES